MAPADPYRHPRSETRYSELWNYLIQLEGGEVVILCFLVSNLGWVGGSANVSLSWHVPGQPRVLIEHRLKPSDYRERPAEGVLALGPYEVRRVGEVTEIALGGPEIQGHLRLRAWMPGFTLGPRGGALPGRSGRFHRVFVEIPRADVAGELVVQGQTHTLRGAAYADHVVQNATAPDFSQRWTTLRAFGPQHTLVVVQYTYPASLGGGSGGFGFLAEGPRVVAAQVGPLPQPLAGTDWQDPDGYRVATGFRLALPLLGGPGRLQVEARSAGLLARSDVVGDLSWVERQVVRLFAGRPIIYRFRSTLDARRIDDGGEQRLPLDGFHEISMMAP